MRSTVALQSGPNRRRPRRKMTVVKDHSLTGGDTAAVVATAAPRLRALIREAQQEMEHGTDILGDELDNLWRKIREVAGVIETEDDRETGRGETSTATAVEKGGRRSRSGGRGRVVGTRPARRLPPEEVDALLTGLAKLQSEMQAEAQGFQEHKAELVRRVETLEDSRNSGGRERRRGRCNDEQVVALEEAAKSLRTGVIASHGRLLGRVRGLQRLPRRLGSVVVAASSSAATTASYNNTAAAHRMESGTATAPLGSCNSLDDLVDSAQAVLAARGELERLNEAVKGTKNELARDADRGRAAREQVARLEALRSSAAAAASRAKGDAKKARAEAEEGKHALDATQSRLRAAEIARSKIDEAVDSERSRLESLRREAVELEAGLQTAAREVEEREVRAAVAAKAAELEEARLADCRDSFGLEVEGLQKGVGELESEALGWREAIEQARSTLRTEEEQGRVTKARVEADVKRLQEGSERLKTEAHDLDTRVRGLRRKHDSDGTRLARETRSVAMELATLKSKLEKAQSALQAGHAELEGLTKELEEKSVAVRAADDKMRFLDRQSTELASHVARLEAERERATREGETARRRQGEELACWKEAVAERRMEFEELSELIRSETTTLEDLKSQAETHIARAQQARGKQENAEAKVQAALRAAREAAVLAERSKDKAEREEARAALAESRTAETVEQRQRQLAGAESENASLGKVMTDLEEARRTASEAQAESSRARHDLAALAERRREEEHAIAGARQRAATLAREEASLRAAAAAARREGGESRDAVTAARSELAEILEAVDRERRSLEGFRDRGATVEAELARKKEEDRFAREAVDAQQARLDEIKREVTLLRDERLRVEKNVWALKSDLEILSTRRDDATRRDRRREREEGALAARRDALAEEVLREEERLGQATAAKEAIEAEVAELDVRAGSLTVEAGDAAQEASALREDAASAAKRADEARRQLTALEMEIALLKSGTDTLRTTKCAFTAELDGLRHELDTLRGTKRANGREESGGAATGTRTTSRETSRARREHRETPAEGGEPGSASDYNRESEGVWNRLGDDNAGAGNLVEVVAEFQGRLRRQVRAALASTGASRGECDSGDAEAGSFSPSKAKSGRRVVASVLSRHAGASSYSNLAQRKPQKRETTGRRRSSQNVLGELGRRVGSV